MTRPEVPTSSDSIEETKPKISDHPNPWSILHDGTKILVTLATALLGLTVTFAQDFAGESERSWIGAGWALLALSIFANIYTIGAINYRVRKTSTASKYGDYVALGTFNASFILLFAGICCIAWGAWTGWNTSNP